MTGDPRTPVRAARPRRPARRRGAPAPRHRAPLRRRPHPARRSPRWFASGTIPARELARELGDARRARHAPRGYGCAGTSAVGVRARLPRARGRRLRAPLAVSVQGSLAMFAIHRFGSEEQKQRVAAADGRGRGDRLLRADRARPRLRPGGHAHPRPARRRRLGPRRHEDVDHQRRGRRRRRRLGPHRRGHPRLRRPDRHPRLLRARDQATSSRCAPRSPASSSSTTCGCPRDAVLPEADGLRGPLSCLNEARFGIVFGVARRRPRLPRDRDRLRGTREQFGRPIAGFQLTQRKLADMAVELDKGLLLALHLGRLKDAGTLRPSRSASASSTTCARRWRSPARPARSSAPTASPLEYPVMRHAANLESVLTYEGTSEIHTLVLGQALTGHRRVPLSRGDAQPAPLFRRVLDSATAHQDDHGDERRQATAQPRPAAAAGRARIARPSARVCVAETGVSVAEFATAIAAGRNRLTGRVRYAPKSAGERALDDRPSGSTRGAVQRSRCARCRPEQLRPRADRRPSRVSQTSPGRRTGDDACARNMPHSLRTPACTSVRCLLSRATTRSERLSSTARVRRSRSGSKRQQPIPWNVPHPAHGLPDGVIAGRPRTLTTAYQLREDERRNERDDSSATSRGARADRRGTARRHRR